MSLTITCISASESNNTHLSDLESTEDQSIDSNTPVNEGSSKTNSFDDSSNTNKVSSTKANIKNSNPDTIDDFEELSYKINNTPKGQILTLNKNYKFVNSSNINNKGILISKSITIDGNGHTIDANKVSRIFNIVADNVILKNINFLNGNILGSYNNITGGGAIYWSGTNGKLLNCNFINNTGSEIEDDPYEEVVTSEDGRNYNIRIRPVGALTNKGGAIVWKGNNGTISNCTFKNNNVGYPNQGGAIYWSGNNGKITNSLFYNNSAWAGGAIYWSGNNGKILSTQIIDNGMFTRDIFWAGKNGTIRKSILFNQDHTSVIYIYSGSLDANYNFWGDTYIHPNSTEKINKLSNWYILNSTSNHPRIIKGDKVLIDFEDLLLVTKNGNVYNNKKELIDRINLNPKTKIVSKNLMKYYKGSKQFKVRVYYNGKLVTNKYVTFKIGAKTYKVKSNKKGVATLKINQKPGEYSVLVQYKLVKVTRKITVNSTLVTKNVTTSKKTKRDFKIKVLTSNGKPYSKQVVKIKFIGKTYKLKTNKNGIAKFNLPKNLNVGKYRIKVSYNGLKNTNTITVKE